jgi:DNA-binding MarR family transcriptional regulator
MLESLVSFRFSKISSGLSLPTSRIYAARFGLALLDWRVLSALKHHAPMTIAEIAAKIDADKGNVSRSVTALSKDRLVVRRPADDDGRKVHLDLSERGRALFERINPIARSREAELLSVLSPTERAQLDRLTGKLLEQLEKMNAAV